jgi:hypothetical protein
MDEVEKLNNPIGINAFQGPATFCFKVDNFSLILNIPNEFKHTSMTWDYSSTGIRRWYFKSEILKRLCLPQT